MIERKKGKELGQSVRERERKGMEFPWAGKMLEKKKKICRDQDSNLGYYGHNVMS